MNISRDAKRWGYRTEYLKMANVEAVSTLVKLMQAWFRKVPALTIVAQSPELQSWYISCVRITYTLLTYSVVLIDAFDTQRAEVETVTEVVTDHASL